MSEKLYIQEARRVLNEPGFNLHFPFGKLNVQGVRDLVRQGLLRLDGVDICPVSGYLHGTPNRTMSGMVTADWTTTGTWEERKPRVNPDGSYPTFMAQKGTGDWTLTGPERAAGTSFYLYLVTYDSVSGEGSGVGTSDLTARFGDWTLELLSDGQAWLSRAGSVEAGFEWMAADRYSPRHHWLWVYEVGDKLCIRNLAIGVGETTGGLLHVVSGAVEDPQDLDPDGKPRRHAIPAGRWSLTGSGYVTVGWVPQTWVAGTSTVEQPRPSTLAFGQTTQAAVPTIYGYGVTPTVSITDRYGTVWPDTGTGSPKESLKWAVTWTNTATTTLFLSAVSIKVNRSTRITTETGTDLLTLAKGKQITLTREDVTRETLTADLFDHAAGLPAYLLPNAPVRYEVDGATIFRGLTSTARFASMVDTSPQVGNLILDVEGAWARFRHALWPGGDPFDGLLLTEALQRVLESAGLDPADYSLCPWSYRLPIQDGEEPGIVYRPGTSVDHILEDLATKFYGTALRHYIRLSDGLFVLEEVTTPASSCSFYATTAAAAAAGVPHQVVLAGTYSETLVQDRLHNYVAVIGQQADGTPLLARAVDWPSINTETATNFVGEVWPMIVSDPGLRTLAAVQWVARSLLERHRLPTVTAQWESLRCNVFPGDVVTLYGGPWGVGTSYRLTGVALSHGASGDEAHPRGRATYAGVLL